MLAAAVVERSIDGCAIMDRDGRYLLFNPAMERFTGKTAAEVLGRSAFEVFPFLRDLGLEAAFVRALAGEHVAINDVSHVEPDGTRKVYDRLYLPLSGPGSEVSGVIALVHDNTSRHAARQALRATQEHLLMAAQAAAIGLWTWDRATDLLTWDDTMCALYGREPGQVPRGRAGYAQLIHPEDRAASIERITRGVALGHWEHEYRILRPDGVVRWLASRARTIKIDSGELAVGATFDVTEQRQLEERQRAAQRLEVVGQLTAGIAHNFNNLLMGILPTIGLAAASAPPDILPHLRVAEHSAQRAATVVKELMTYASRRETSRQTQPIAPLVERTATFCRTTLDRRVMLEVTSRGGASANVDASQIEQAVLNLLINARDALLDHRVGMPTIEVAVDVVAQGADELEGRGGDWVAIRVRDNGVGMSPATLERIYEPFFTTKPADKGTGLGLATTHTIIKNHGGFIACASSPSKGTRFSLYLPRSGAGAPSATPGGETSTVTEERPVKDARILVVDDDAAVRAVIRTVLASQGFAAEAVGSGQEAIARVAGDGPRFDLVLLDVSMAGLSGPETRRRLASLAPELPVVFLTGYAFEAAGGDAVLEKPVTQAALVATVRDTLSRAPRCRQGSPGGSRGT
jgi:PAS domain S-box-containing protein